MTSTELISKLGITRNQLRHWRKRGLPHTRQGRRLVFEEHAVLAWLQAEGLVADSQPAATGRDQPPLVVTSQGAIAEWFGVSVHTVENWSRRAMPGETSANGQAGRYDCQAIARWRENVDRKSHDSDGAKRKLAAEIAIAEANAEIKQKKARQLDGELVEFAAVRQWVSQHILTIKDRLLGIPAEVALHVPQRHRDDVEEVVSDLIKRTLTEFAESKPPRGDAHHEETDSTTEE